MKLPPITPEMERAALLYPASISLQTKWRAAVATLREHHKWILDRKIKREDVRAHK